jgi:hypothetical protein
MIWDWSFALEILPLRHRRIRAEPALAIAVGERLNFDEMDGLAEQFAGLIVRKTAAEMAAMEVEFVD